MISFLILNCLLWFGVGMKLNMYNTDRSLDIGNLQVNCLHYYVRRLEPRMEKVEYCFGPIEDNNYLLNDDSLHLHGEYFTFDQLHQLNVTSNNLLLWSSTIDLAEKYQDYLNHQTNSSLSKELFFNCTPAWFGPRCQYSIVLNSISSFEAVIVKAHADRYPYETSYSTSNATCYIHLSCNRGQSNICLDWREVCNGRIDCTNEAVDEAQCFELEMNVCHENEYRCHNGQCIPTEFVKDAFAECLDLSDARNTSPDISHSHFIFLFEEHWCALNYRHFFCMIEECVIEVDQCENIRYRLSIESITIQNNSSNNCWMLMICLTKILKQIHEATCQQFSNSSYIRSVLENCDDVIEFPRGPVIFGHVRFLYHTKEITDVNTYLVRIPDAICYDNQLCDFLIPTYYYRNYSCRYFHQFNFNSNKTHNIWDSFIRLIEGYFQKCSLNYHQSMITDPTDYPSLYCCQNSSKCISEHRILDHMSDCYLNDDEEQYELSCSINDILRLKCALDNRCYFSNAFYEICIISHLRTFDKIEFGQICDRHIEMIPQIINGINHTDETDCEDWPCNNYYTRCDGFWSCPNGEDEENCTTQKICPSHFLPCIDPYNSTMICLSANRVNDGNIDCLGATDEREHCRNFLQIDLDPSGFRCWDDDDCLQEIALCDHFRQCPNEEDEKFCQNYKFFGELSCKMDSFNLTDIENAICQTIYLKKIPFTLETSLAHSTLDNQTNQQVVVRQPRQEHNIPKLVSNELNYRQQLRHCNRGLYVLHWLGNNQTTHKCLCPPSYYGDRCQYQNQRVSLTIQTRLMNISNLYAAYISLIDDDDYRQKIISYQQYSFSTPDPCMHISDSCIYTSGSCMYTFDGYLTYEARPKNRSTNYAIRIDIYDRTSLIYIASWHYTVLHSFLPVNRMAVVLYIPAEQVLSVSSCSLECENGACMKYVNKDKYYCQCDDGWSGMKCTIPVRCSDCSSDSICIGMIYNRSICVCPLNTGGPRCLLTFSYNHLIMNNTKWLIVDDDLHGLSGIRICSKGFFGTECDIPASKITISFENIKISPIVLVYTLYFSIDSNANGLVIENAVIAQKLTIFQRILSVFTPNVFQLVFVKTDYSYYLAFVQQKESTNISTSIDSSRQCTSIDDLFTIEQQRWPPIRRMKYYNKLCQIHLNTLCFIDDSYACLCTVEHHANCFLFRSTPPKCRDQFYCQNGGNCVQDVAECPTTFMCNCTDCFFGDRCQYYAKSIGLVLDDILRYEIRPNVTLSQQSTIIQWSCGLIMIIFVGGLINGILSVITFSTKQARENGCGLYLMASSITSLLTISILAVKFWFLLLTQIHPSVSRSTFRIGCISFEFLLKTFLYTDNWLNACVALERSMTVHKGIKFNKRSSKRVAQWIIFILPFLIAISIIHEPLYRELFDDTDEQRFWCVFHYSSSVQIYNIFIICIHFLGPFCANLLSAFFIIFAGTHQRTATQRRFTYNQHLRNQFREHKNLIISPIILVLLSIPGQFIAIYSNCVKVSHNAWLYLLGYLISFLPSMSIFIIFIIPSVHYKKQFKQAIRCHTQR